MSDSKKAIEGRNPLRIRSIRSTLLTVFLSIAFLGAFSSSGSSDSPAGSVAVTLPVNATTGGSEEVLNNQLTESPVVDSQQTSFFFSYDKSASTTPSDQTLTALANSVKRRPELRRPNDFLNAEQTSMDAANVADPFYVSMGLHRSENRDIPINLATENNVYGLGAGVAGPTQTLEDRRNVVLTKLLDISGSMDSLNADETGSEVSTLLDVAKIGLNSMQQSLKQGAIENLVTFSTDADVLLKAYSPSPDNLTGLVDGIFTHGFSRFLSPAAREVKFQLTDPQELDQLKSFAEEISTESADVQSTNFSYNSSQFFLELFSGPNLLSADGELRLDITYRDDDGQWQSVFVTYGVDNIVEKGAVEIKAATAIATLAQLINGSLNCDAVQSSQLYNTPVQHEVYVNYMKNIDQFCSL